MDKSTLKFASRLIFNKLTGSYSPFLVQFSITNRCNLRCNYCYRSYYDRPHEDLSLKDVKEIIDALANAGTFRINLVGGEPLLRNDIGEIVSYIKSKGIECAMTTNGLLVPAKIDTVKMLSSVCFSLDGKKEGNDLNRAKGSYDAVIRALELCKSERITSQISAVLTRHTVRDVDFLVEIAKQYKSLVGFSTLIRQIDQDTNTLGASNEQMKEALRRIIELKKAGSPILFSKQAYEYALNWPDYQTDLMHRAVDGFKPIKCYAGRFFIIIDYNGDVYPCPQLVGIFRPKNILKDGLDEAIKNSANHRCLACSVPCSNEFSMFFALRPSVLIDQFKRVVKRPCH